MCESLEKVNIVVFTLKTLKASDHRIYLEPTETLPSFYKSKNNDWNLL